MTRAFFDYLDARESISPEYDDCAGSCVYFPNNQPKYKFCANCPVGIAKKEFEESATEVLTENRPDALKKYGFRHIYRAVLSVIEFESLPPAKLTLPVANLLDLYKSERQRIQRINDWIRRNNAAREE